MHAPPRRYFYLHTLTRPSSALAGRATLRVKLSVSARALSNTGLGERRGLSRDSKPSSFTSGKPSRSCACASSSNML